MGFEPTKGYPAEVSVVASFRDLDDFVEDLEVSGRSRVHIERKRAKIARFLEFSGDVISRDTVRDFLLSLKVGEYTRPYYYQAVKQFLRYLDLDYVMKG